MEILKNYVLKVYQINDHIVGLLFLTSNYLCDFVDDLENLYCSALKEKMNWEQMRKMILEIVYSKKSIIPSLNEHLTDDEMNARRIIRVNNEVSKELELIHKYQTDGTMDGLSLIVFVDETVGRVKIQIENVDVELSYGTNVFKYQKFDYVPISYTDYFLSVYKINIFLHNQNI